MIRLPKFWPESGHLNDGAVGLFIILGGIFFAWLTWGKGGAWFLLVFPGGPVIGFLVGFLFIALMSSCFGKGPGK